MTPRFTIIISWRPVPANHLRTSFGKIDIALDIFPHKRHRRPRGAVDGCAGEYLGRHWHAGRVGVNLPGLPEPVAQDEDDYPRLTVALAEDPARLKGLRQGLRERMRGSSLCDAKGFTRQLEAAYRGMWRGWCGGER